MENQKNPMPCEHVIGGVFYSSKTHYNQDIRYLSRCKRCNSMWLKTNGEPVPVDFERLDTLEPEDRKYIEMFDLGVKGLGAINLSDHA